MLCCSFAFACCMLTIMDDFVCNAAGPLGKECRKMAALSAPMASLSFVAALAIMFLTGMGGVSMRR